MLLSNAATFFDRTPCNDGYTGDFLFMAQLGLYDDSKRDAESSERRVISTAPSAPLPARGVVNMLGSRYILGKSNPDVFDGEVIRVGHIAHETSTLAVVRTLDQASLNDGGTEVWSAHAWVKNKAFTEQGSGLTPEFHLFFSASETVEKNYIISYQGIQYIARARNLGASGIKVVTAEEIQNPSFEEGAVRSGYDRVLGTFSTDEDPIRLLRIRWQALFDYGSLSKPFGPDEEQFIISKSEFDAVAGAQITLTSGVFKVNSVDEVGDVWVCRVARHA